MKYQTLNNNKNNNNSFLLPAVVTEPGIPGI